MAKISFFTEVFKPAHRQAMSLLWPLLARNWGWLSALWLVSFVVPQGLEEFAHFDQASGPQIALILSLAFVDLSLTFLIYLFLPARALELKNQERPRSLGQLTADHGKDLVSEQLRVAASVIVGIVMLIVPGLIRILQYLFVPILVVVDPRYRAGHLDALDHSKKLSQGLLWPLAWLTFALFLVDAGLYFLEQMPGRDTAESLVWAWQGLLSLISLLMRIYSVLLTLGIYEILNSRKGVSE